MLKKVKFTDYQLLRTICEVIVVKADDTEAIVFIMINKEKEKCLILD